MHKTQIESFKQSFLKGPSIKVWTGHRETTKDGAILREKITQVI
jgi:hypothetical protein